MKIAPNLCFLYKCGSISFCRFEPPGVMILILFSWRHKNLLLAASCSPLIKSTFVQSHPRLFILQHCHSECCKKPLTSAGEDKKVKNNNNKTGSDSWPGHYRCDSTEVAFYNTGCVVAGLLAGFWKNYLSPAGSHSASYMPNVMKLQSPPIAYGIAPCLQMLSVCSLPGGYFWVSAYTVTLKTYVIRAEIEVSISHPLQIKLHKNRKYTSEPLPEGFIWPVKLLLIWLAKREYISLVVLRWQNCFLPFSF